ncbi:protein with putative role during mitosis [Blyttiomyces sp. JEL0837]|nr:protein with putative role during mitosis [Blyttiomyces sp. JEL0837]
MTEATPTPLEPLLTLNGHTNAVSSLVITGGRLYSASKDSTIKEWDLQTGECLRTFVGHSRWVRSLCIGAGRIFSGSWDDTVREWDLESGECVRVFEGAHELGINSVLVDEHAARLYSGSDDRNIAVYDLNSGENIDTWHGVGIGSVSTIVSVAPANSGGGMTVLPGGEPQGPAGGFIVSASSDGSVCLWDTATGECLENGSASAHEVTSLAVVGGRLYSAGNDRVIHEWDMATWKSGRAFRGHQGYVSCIIGTMGTGEIPDENSPAAPVEGEEGYLSNGEPPGGPRLFSGSWDGTVRVWDLVGGHCIGIIKAHERSINCMVLGDQGRLCTASGDGSIKIWDISKLPASAMGTVGVPIPAPISSPFTFSNASGPSSSAPYKPPGHVNGSSVDPSKVCQFYLRGDCRFGDRCRNLHV